MLETPIPRLATSATTDSAVSSTSTAGSSVATVASGERNTASRTTTISRIDRYSVREPSPLAWPAWSAVTARLPAVCRTSPGGVPAAPNRARSERTKATSGAFVCCESEARISIRAAWRSPENSAIRAVLVCGSRLARAVRRAIAASSARLSRWWPLVAATTKASSLLDAP